MKEKKYRIRQKNTGYVVEESFKNFFGFTKWKTLVTASGSDSAWEHSSIEFAKKSLIESVLNNTEFP